MQKIDFITFKDIFRNNNFLENQNLQGRLNAITSLADPVERTVLEYSDRSLIVLWPFYDLALLRLRTVKKTLNALQL